MTNQSEARAVLADCAEFLSDIDGALAKRCEAAIATLQGSAALPSGADAAITYLEGALGLLRPLLFRHKKDFGELQIVIDACVKAISAMRATTPTAMDQRNAE